MPKPSRASVTVSVAVTFSPSSDAVNVSAVPGRIPVVSKASLRLALGIGGDGLRCGRRATCNAAAGRPAARPSKTRLAEFASMVSPRNQTRRGNSIASLIFSSLNERTSNVPWKCERLLALAVLVGGDDVLAVGGGGGQHERRVERAEAADLHRLLGQQAALRIGDADLELAVFRHGIGRVAHLAQDAAQRDGLAGQVGGAIGVEVAFGGQAGRQLRARPDRG